jgi:hypothetical protein
LNQSPIDYDLYTYTGDPESENPDMKCAETPLVQAAGNQQDSEFVDYVDATGQHHTVLVWEDSRNGNWDIYLKDLFTHQEVPVCVEAGDQTNPDITLDSEGLPFIVWQDQRNGNWDIYGTKGINEQALAEKFKPQLILHPEELFRPRKVDIMFSGEGTTFKALDPPNGSQILAQYPDITSETLSEYDIQANDAPGSPTTKYIDLPGDTNLAWGTSLFTEHFLQTNFRDPYDQLVSTDNYPETTYANIITDLETGKTAIQYWFQYYFNYWGNFHEGDWEHVDVILDSSLEPVAAGYSEHNQGRKRPWQYIEGSASHPVVYVARGSHANYFSPGVYDAPFIFMDFVIPGDMVSPNTELLPSVPSSPYATMLVGTPYKWLAYEGLWGEDIANEYGNGPQGPASAPEHNNVWDDPFTWFDSLCWDGIPECQSDPSLDLIGSIASPVDIHLYDSQGNHVGKNESGGIDEQIPNTEYIEIPDVHRKSIIVHGGDGTEGYRFVLQGTGDGTFDFNIGSPDKAGNSSDKINYLSVPVSTATEAEILLDQNKDYSLQIDADGDGIFEQQRQPDSVVSDAVDLTAPGQTGDLSASNDGSATATLSFSAPGDDNAVGAAYSYDIRYATSEITDENWKDAEPLEQIPDALEAGSQVAAAAPGLSGNTTYYFALNSYDEVGNESQLSNVTHVFIPDTAAPDLSYISPTGWISTGETTLSATYTDAAPSGGVDTATATISLNGGAAQACSADNGNIECSQTGLTAGHYAATISITDYAGNPGSVTGGFDVDTAAPLVADVLPQGPISTDSPTITGNYSDTGSGINSATASIWLDGSNLLGGCTTSSGAISCPTSGVPEGSHSMVVIVYDNAGNIGGGGGSFLVDTIAPTLTNLQPQFWTDTTSPNVTASYSDSGSGVDDATATAVLDSGILSGCTVTQTSMSCPTTGLAYGNHSYSVTLSDNAGNNATGTASFNAARDYFWPWYDYQSPGFQSWILFANPAWAGTPDLRFSDLIISGLNYTLPSLPGYSPGQVPAGRVLAASYPGIMNGPVHAVSTTGAMGVLSQRTLLNGNSLEEVPAQERDRLSDHFYWPWYDSYSSGVMDWILVANPNSYPVYYEIKVAGTVRNSGTVLPWGRVSPNFPGLYGQNVEVQAWSDQTKQSPVNVMASQRVTTGSGATFNELPGIPAGGLSSSYYWTWYDNSSAGMADRFFLANPNASQLYYEIWIAGTMRYSGNIAAGELTTRTFPGVMGGPVQVQAWTSSAKQTPANIVSSRRVNYGASFEEIPGYPQAALASDYLWPWYDYASPQTPNWVLVINPNATTIYYEISVAGVVRNYGNLGAGGYVTPSYNGLQGGPVEVQAWTSSTKQTPVNVFASQRVLWNGHFNEVVGTVLR